MKRKGISKGALTILAASAANITVVGFANSFSCVENPFAPDCSFEDSKATTQSGMPVQMAQTDPTGVEQVIPTAVEEQIEPAAEQQVEPAAEQQVEPAAEQQVEPAAEQQVEPAATNEPPVVERRAPPAVERRVRRRVPPAVEQDTQTGRVFAGGSDGAFPY